MSVLLLAGCDGNGDDGRSTLTAPREAPSASEAAAFVSDVAATLSGFAETDAAFAALELAGGLLATATIAPPSDSVAPCTWFDPAFGPIVFRPEQLDVVYRWDADQDAYAGREDGEAPDCGIRLIVYAIDAASAEPAIPLASMGYVDVDETGSLRGNPQRRQLHVTIVSTSGGAADTLARYTTTTDTEFFTRSTSETRDHEGFFERAGQRLEFDRHQSSSFGTISGMPFATGNQSQVFETGGVQASLTREDGEGSDTVTLGALVGDRSVDFLLELGQTMSGEIRAHGTAWTDTGAVARVAGSLEAPVFSDLSGAALPTAEADGFRRFWDALLSGFGIDRWPQL